MDVLLLAVVAFSSAIVTLMLAIRLAPALNLMDHPGGRKQHDHQTPVVGGIALMAGLLPMAFLPAEPMMQSAWWLGSLMLFLMGCLDDLHDIGARYRLMIQTLAALFMVAAGLILQHLGDLVGLGIMALGVFAVPVTVFAVVAAINAMNMVDGVDGLLGSLSVVPLALIALVSHQAGLVFERNLSVTLFVVLVAFLLFNFRFPWNARAHTFMGDAGSTVVGFNLAFLVISLAVKGAMPGVLALFLLAIPLLDAAGVICRRTQRGVSWATPGRDHLHHILLDAGFSVRGTTTLLAACALLLGAGAMLLWRVGLAESVLFALFMVLLVTYVRGFRSVQEAVQWVRRLTRKAEPVV